MRLSIRFQPWIVIVAVVLVLVMTGSFMLVVAGKFERMAEENASDQLAITAGRATGRLDFALQEQRRFVDTLSHLQPELFERRDALEPDALVPLLLSAVRSNPSLYSVYFGLRSGEFLQVVAVRNAPKVAAALQAPAGTEYAVRRIVRASRDGERIERWEFTGANGARLGVRESATAYNPAGRAWFTGALSDGEVYFTEPYRFASNGEPGLTVAAPMATGHGVVAVDITLASFREFLDGLQLSDNGAVVVMSSENRVLGLSARGGRLRADGDSLLKPLNEVTNPLWWRLDQAFQGPAGRSAGVVRVDGEAFVLARDVLKPGGDRHYRIMTAAPLSDFAAALRAARRDILLVALVLLLLLVPIAWLGTRRAAQALQALVKNSDRLRRLDFSQPPAQIQSFLREVNTLATSQRVMYDSLSERTAALELARAKLSRIVETGIGMGRERDRQKLLRDALFGARDIAHCQAATLFIKTGRDTLLFALRTSDDELPTVELPLHDPKTGEPVHQFVATHVALTGESVVIDDIYTETRFDLSGARHFGEESGMRVTSMLAVALAPRKGQIIGTLQLLNCLDPKTGAVAPFAPDLVGFIEALATQAAVTLENQSLLQAQKSLLDATLKIIAGAIDAKSAYTGGHCARVPELALMLAEAAARAKEGPLAGFSFKTEEEWDEFRIGAWLHDCGKVVTPEYVVDKATKLETIYNRIHEVRTRFEVLLRDAEIATHKAIAAGQDTDGAWAAYAQRKRQLQEDFAFVAESNLGDEFTAPGNVERIKAIAGQTWMRHFSDRVGLSPEEERRARALPESELPAQEQLLDDKPQHIVPRAADRALDPRYGFKVKVPEHLYNHGEVYNLCIGRGTLNEEERFKINEHIIQTIMMLEQMPFPDHLKRVPEYAGTHHETLTGSGYPRRLTGDGLSVPARIMAIADIFEALTASDRPYKKTKSLSESIRILSLFKKDRHIDADLFDLFLTSGVYRRYAERYLKPEQIDKVDIQAYLG